MQAATASGYRRHKRLSREDEVELEETLFPSSKETVDQLVSMRSAIATSFIISLVWFAQVVAPLTVAKAQLADPPLLRTRVTPDELGFFVATGAGSFLFSDRTASPELHAPSQASSVVEERTRVTPDELGFFVATGAGSFLFSDRPASPKFHAPSQAQATNVGEDRYAFILTCAAVHAFMACVGIAFGRDTRNLGIKKSAWPLFRALVAAFALYCAALRLAWDFEIGPVAAVLRSTALGCNAFVLLGALSMTLALGCSMLVPHSTLGDVATTSHGLHALIISVGAGVALSDVSVSGSLLAFGVCSSLGLLASCLASAKGTLAAWNL